MDTLEKAKIALRKYILENKEQVLLELEEMRKMSTTEVEPSCKNCKLCDEYNFCEKLVVDTRRCHVDGDYIKAYYITPREEDDDRSSFIVPDDFCCVYYEPKETL